jgi:hypothetical protein
VICDLPDAAAWARAEVLIGNCPESEAATDVLRLEPWEARVHRRIEPVPPR